MKTQDERSNVLVHRQLQYKGSRKMYFEEIVKVLGGKVGWLEGIPGTTGDAVPQRGTSQKLRIKV